MQINWNDYDGLEVSPVKTYPEADGENGTFCEVCEPHEADFWSVYAHLVAGGVECFEDFGTEAEAMAHAENLLADHPQLQKHGIDARRCKREA